MQSINLSRSYNTAYDRFASLTISKKDANLLVLNNDRPKKLPGINSWMIIPLGSYSTSPTLGCNFGLCDTHAAIKCVIASGHSGVEVRCGGLHQ